MADELNTPNHRYYQPQNNILLAANEVSKQFILASGIVKIDAKIINPLFALAEPGVWYDPSDLTTLFQDNVGTAPVTAPGQTVGLMLDKSQGLALGSELVTNGDFSSATGWTAETGWSIAGGAATKVVSAANANLYQTVSIVAGRSYRVTYTLTYSAGGFQMILGGTASSVKLASGTYSEIIIAGSTNQLISAFGNTAFAGSIDNISIKLLAGNHATQATLAQRPTYGINPIVGTRNLLLQSQSAITSPWSFDASTGSGITLTGGLASDGTTQFAVFNEGTSTSAHRANQSVTVSAGATVTVSAEFKAGTSRYILLGTNRGGISIDTNDGTITQTIAAASTTTTNGVVTSLGGGLYRARVSVSHTTDTTIFYIISTATSSTSGTMAPSFAGTSRTAIFTFSQIELGSTATAYQKVVSQYEVTEAGVASTSYLRFDGVDDGMVTNTITPGIDKVQVFAGVRKLSDANAALLVGSNTSTFNGSFEILAPISAGNYRFASKGSIEQVAVATGFPAPITNILTTIGDISSDVTTLRINGVQAATSAADQGSGNYLAYPLYIGRRAAGTVPFNGRIYSLITRFGANLTTGQITSTESWVNSKVGAY